MKDRVLLRGVTLKRRGTHRPSFIYLIVNKLLSLSLSLSLSPLLASEASANVMVQCDDLTFKFNVAINIRTKGKVETVERALRASLAEALVAR